MDEEETGAAKIDGNQGLLRLRKCQKSRGRPMGARQQKMQLRGQIETITQFFDLEHSFASKLQSSVGRFVEALTTNSKYQEVPSSDQEMYLTTVVISTQI